MTLGKFTKNRARGGNLFKRVYIRKRVARFFQNGAIFLLGGYYAITSTKRLALFHWGFLTGRVGNWRLFGKRSGRKNNSPGENSPLKVPGLGDPQRHNKGAFPPRSIPRGKKQSLGN